MAQSFRKILKKDKVKAMNLRQIKTYDTIKLYFRIMPLPLLGDGFFIFRSHKRKENLYEQG